MLNLIAMLFKTTPAAKVEVVARQVVDSSLASATQLVAADLAEMSLSEARGFIRARCGRLLRRHTRMAINNHAEADICWTPQVLRMATERLIPVVLRESRVGMPRQLGLKMAA